MPRWITSVSFTIVVMFLAGCAATKDVEFKAYIDNQPRLDQQMQGNAGYLMGTAAPSTVERKKTREIFTFEFNKPADAVPDEVYKIERTVPANSPEGQRLLNESRRASTTQPDITIPPLDSIQLPNQGGQASGSTVTMVDYTVAKDDTLQKISNKFYNSHGKWTKIYEANKDIIKDPNRIKPGLVIKIPIEQ